MLLGWLVDPRFIQFAVLLAVIAGILELLPIIGPIIAMIPTLLIALTINLITMAVALPLVMGRVSAPARRAQEGAAL